MSDLFSKINDDEEEYERACLIYDEEVEHNYGPDCYGKHAQKVIKRMYKDGLQNISKQEILRRKSCGELKTKKKTKCSK